MRAMYNFEGYIHTTAWVKNSNHSAAQLRGSVSKLCNLGEYLTSLYLIFHLENENKSMPPSAGVRIINIIL